MAKITVNLPDDVVEAIEEMAKEKGITKTEALRQAVSVSSFIEDELKKNSKLLIEREGETTQKELVFK